MPLTWVKCLVVALMTSVLSFVGLFAGVQPSSRLSCGPTVAPLGPQLLSGKTPVFVAGSKAPSTMTGRVTVVGSITISPPSQRTLAVGVGAVTHPGGLFPRTGTDT